jgi:hypothetical protein
MGWGTAANVTTTSLDSANDSPALARIELYNALIELLAVINGRGTVSGVASLDATTKVPAAQLPDTFLSSSSTNLTLNPSTNVVVIQNVLKLIPITRATAYALSGKADGMVVMLSNGDSTVAKPAYYAGGVFRYFSDDTQVPST